MASTKKRKGPEGLEPLEAAPQEPTPSEQVSPMAEEAAPVEARPALKSIGVVGAGTMGAGIAQVAATAGYQVFLTDADRRGLDRGVVAIRQSLDKFVNKGRMMRPVRDGILDRLEPVADLEALQGCDLVIEAVTEVMAVKQELFRRLDGLCKPEALLATNTSSLPVTEMAMATNRPDRFLGLHFFNPPVLMKLVEVVRTPLTSEATFQTCWDAVERMQKTPVLTRDTPGFLFNRLIIPYLNEAAWALYEGAGTIEDLDKAMLLGGNMPIGPLALLDLIGLDVVQHACEALHAQFQDPKFRLCPLIRQMVRAGFLGRKSGRGFFDYGGEEPRPVDLSAFRA